jgi:pimeloyl-ACP methyl ester carboxylesterase
MKLAQRKPQQLYAYIGVGQIINMRQAEKIGYEHVLETARKADDAQAVEELEAIAPYPEADGAIPIEKIGTERKWSVHYGFLTHGRDNYAVWENTERISPDYSDADFKAIDEGSGFSFPKLLPQLAAVDFTGVTRLGCPVLIFAGRYDYTTPSELAAWWEARVQSPYKRLVWFENSAHMMYEEEPGRVLVHLVEDALPLAHADPNGN